MLFKQHIRQLVYCKPAGTAAGFDANLTQWPSCVFTWSRDAQGPKKAFFPFSLHCKRDGCKTVETFLSVTIPAKSNEINPNLI